MRPMRKLTPYSDYSSNANAGAIKNENRDAQEVLQSTTRATSDENLSFFWLLIADILGRHGLYSQARLLLREATFETDGNQSPLVVSNYNIHAQVPLTLADMLRREGQFESAAIVAALCHAHKSPTNPQTLIFIIQFQARALLNQPDSSEAIIKAEIRALDVQGDCLVRAMKLAKESKRYHTRLKYHSTDGKLQTEDETTEQTWLDYSLALVRVYKATLVGRILIRRLRTMSTTNMKVDKLENTDDSAQIRNENADKKSNTNLFNSYLDNIISTIIELNNTQCENIRKLFNMRRRIDGCYFGTLAQQTFTQFRAALDRLALVSRNGSNFRYTIEQNARKLEQHLFSVARTLQLVSNLATSVPRALLTNSPILIETNSNQSSPMQRFCVDCKLSQLTLLLHVYKQYARKRLHVHRVTRTYAESGQINRRSINEYLYVNSPEFSIDPLEVTCADTLSTQINECFNNTPDFVRAAFCQLLLRAGQMYAITASLEGPDVVDMWQANAGSEPSPGFELNNTEICNATAEKKLDSKLNASDGDSSEHATSARDNKLSQKGSVRAANARKQHGKVKQAAAKGTNDAKIKLQTFSNITNLLKHQNLAISRLEMCVRKALDGKCWTVAAEACLDLMDLYGRANPYECFRHLCTYQSCVVSQQIVEMLKCILHDKSQSLLAQMLHCSYNDDSVIDHVAPERQRFDSLCNASKCWRRVDVDANVNALLAKLPTNFNVIVLQHNADKSMLYAGVLTAEPSSLPADDAPSTNIAHADTENTTPPPKPIQSRCQVARISTDIDKLNSIISRLNDWKVAVTGWIKRGDILGSGWNTRYEDDDEELGSSGANLNINTTGRAVQLTTGDGGTNGVVASAEKLARTSSEQQHGIDEELRLEATLVKIVRDLELYLAPLLSQLTLPTATDTKPPCKLHWVLLFDMDLLQMPLEALSWFKSNFTPGTTNESPIKSISRDYSLQFLCNRLNLPTGAVDGPSEAVYETYNNIRDIKLTGSVQNQPISGDNSEDTAKKPNKKSEKGKKDKGKPERASGGKDAMQSKVEGKEKAGGKGKAAANKKEAKGAKGGKKSPKGLKSGLHADAEPIEPRTDCYLINKTKVSFVADPLREYDLLDYRSPRKIITDFFNLHIKSTNIAWRGNVPLPETKHVEPNANSPAANVDENGRKSDATTAAAASAEMFSTPEQWIEVMQTPEWTECFMYYAAQGFFATAMPLLLTQTNLSRVGLVLLFDRMRSRHEVDARLLKAFLSSSSILKDNITSHTVAAAILSFSGVRSVCLNQWSASSIDNAGLFNSVIANFTNDYQSSAEVVASLRAQDETYTESISRKHASIVGDQREQQVVGGARKAHEWTRQKYNFVCFGLPNVAFNV